MSNKGAAMTAIRLDSFTQAYVECAIWSSTQDDGSPMDDDYGVDDLAPEALASIIQDCRQFQADNAADWQGLWSDESAGHDFWLTRNGHGAGFWDRYSEGRGAYVGGKLTTAAKAWGSSDLYIGDDGLVYVS
jgi:hypothetical protein